MDEYHQKTCIRFRPRTSSDRNYVELRNGNGCNSFVGMTGRNPQTVNLQVPGCLYHGTIIHELGHAIGFLHTHQRTDRDNFIRVQMENVDDQFKFAFNKESGRNLVGYDTKSVMHYYSYAFSKNRKPTILTKSGGEIQYANVLSSSDITAIKMLYKC